MRYRGRRSASHGMVVGGEEGRVGAGTGDGVAEEVVRCIRRGLEEAEERTHCQAC